MLQLIRRNLLIYLRDRAAVFFSVLSVLIAVGIYILFLAELQIDNIENVVNGYGIPTKDIKWLVNCWIIAGLLSIVPVTSCLGSFGVMVEDCEKKIMKDFRSAPIHTFKYPVAAVFSSAIVGFIMSVLSFLLYSIYIVVQTGYSFHMEQMMEAVGMIMLTSIFSCTILGLFVSFFKTSSSYNGLSIIIGTIVGFINGVYVPLGILPKFLQVIVKVIPFSHTATVFRKILMTEAMNQVFVQGNTQAVLDYRELYGVDYIVNNKSLSIQISLLYAGIWSLVSLGIYFLKSRNKVKEC